MKNVKKLIHKLVGWYVDPIRDRCQILELNLNDIKTELSQLQLHFAEHQEQLTAHQERMEHALQQQIEAQDHIRASLQCAEEQRAASFARLEQESVSHQRQPDGHQEQLNGHQEQLDRHQLLIDECAIRLKRTWQAVSNTSEAKNDVPVRYAMMPYHSIEAEGITYFFQKDDEEIPGCMDRTGMNYSKYDIDHFLLLADQYAYRGDPPKTGLFLAIGGNIGTTTIYCKKKKKPQ